VRASLKRANEISRSIGKQSGQAMSEFLVTVAFAFLPLFVLVPTLGKIMDLQFQNQMAARYAVWERTVWFDNLSGENRDDFVVSGNKWESVALRSESEVVNSLKNRFFLNHSSGPIRPILSSDVNLGGGPGSSVWTYMQSNNSMYESTSVTSFSEQDTPGLAYGVTEFFADGLAVIKKPINFLLGAIGNDNEDLFGFPLLSSAKGYYTPTVKTKLNVSGAHGGGTSTWDRTNGGFSPGIESAIFQSWDGVLTSRGAILSDGWSAQSVAHYKDRVDDLVPSDVFDNAVINGIISLAAALENGKSNSAIGKLKFGDVSIEPMPLRQGDPAPIECPKGVCEFVD
jgi:hypothetical protein